MFRVFNCGIGMVAVVAEQDAERSAHLAATAGATVFRIGRIRDAAAGEAQIFLA